MCIDQASGSPLELVLVLAGFASDESITALSFSSSCHYFSSSVWRRCRVLVAVGPRLQWHVRDHRRRRGEEGLHGPRYPTSFPAFSNFLGLWGSSSSAVFVNKKAFQDCSRKTDHMFLFSLSAICGYGNKLERHGEKSLGITFNFSQKGCLSCRVNIDL